MQKQKPYHRAMQSGADRRASCCLIASSGSEAEAREVSDPGIILAGGEEKP